MPFRSRVLVDWECADVRVLVDFGMEMFASWSICGVDMCVSWSIVMWRCVSRMAPSFVVVT